MKTKNIKFVLSVLIPFLLIFSMMASAASAAAQDAPVPVMAETTASELPAAEFADPAKPADLEKKVKEAITAVKKFFDIDEKIYTEFNYSYNPGDGQYNPESWYLGWTSGDYNSNINATVTESGTLIGYSKYIYSEKSNLNRLKLAVITKTAAKTAAEKFLKKVLGNEFGKFKLNSQSLYFTSDRYYLNYILTKNGYDHPDYSLSVEVDKLTGEIMGFYRYGHQFFYDLSRDIFSYQDSSKPITKKDALGSYLDKIGIDLIYSSYYDWQTRELTIRPVYRLKNNYSEYISAVDGSLVKIDRDIYPASRDAQEQENSVSAAPDGAGGGVSFSPAELSAIENAGKYISADEAIAAMIKAFDLKLDLSAYQKSSRLAAGHINKNQYVWDINIYKNSDTDYEYYNASVDARNGNIINYSNYFYEQQKREMQKTKPKYLFTYEKAKEAVIKKIKEISPYDIDENFEFTENINSGIVPMEESDMSPSYYFNFTRKANGILFENNYIYVGFNNITGKISNYGLEWYEDAKFPELKNIITPADALERTADYAGYDISYMSNGMTNDGKINVSLLYSFKDSVMVDPFTGKWLGWDFKELQKYETAPPDYKDLGGHWSEKIVNKLTENGIYVWGGESFSPDSGITKSELLQYFGFYTNNYWMFADTGSNIFVNPASYYRNLKQGDPDADKILTKQAAAKIICEIAGYGELGKKYDIFNYGFDKDGCDEEYRGYITILQAFCIISGDSEGNYDARADLTRAETASIIYNMLTAVGADQK